MHQHVKGKAFLEAIRNVVGSFAFGGLDRAVSGGCNMGKSILPEFVETSFSVAQNIKNISVRALNKANRSRIMGRNKCLLDTELGTNIPKDLVFKFCPIVAKVHTRSRVNVDEVGDKGMRHFPRKLFRDGSQDSTTTMWSKHTRT